MKRMKGKQTEIKPKKKAGRKGYFESDFERQVTGLAKLGATDKDIADFFQVSVKTIDYWKKNKPDFMKAMKRGKLEFDMKVVESFGRRALGYSYDEVHITKFTDKKGERVTETKVVTKHIAPNVTAGIFWLKNRQRDKWSDTTKTELTGSINVENTGTIDHKIIEKLPEADKRALKKYAIEQLKSLKGVSKN